MVSPELGIDYGSQTCTDLSYSDHPTMFPDPQVWDDELAYMAQFWAANCEYELNENRNSQSTNYDYVGESLAAMSSYTVNYTVLIRGWYELRRQYNYYSGYCTDEDGNQDEDGEACAAYTQVIYKASSQ